MDNILEVRDLSRVFRDDNKAEFLAVDHVSFSIPQGCCFGLIGESGSGKSTIARQIGGLLPPSSGTITYDGRQLTGRGAMAQRRGMQMIFQSPYSSFSPKMKLKTALAEGLRYQKLCPASEFHSRPRRSLYQKPSGILPLNRSPL